MHILLVFWKKQNFHEICNFLPFEMYAEHKQYEGAFYVRKAVDLLKTAKVNTFIVHIFGKIEFLSIHTT